LSSYYKEFLAERIRFVVENYGASKLKNGPMYENSNSALM